MTPPASNKKLYFSWKNQRKKRDKDKGKWIKSQQAL